MGFFVGLLVGFFVGSLVGFLVVGLAVGFLVDTWAINGGILLLPGAAAGGGVSGG